MTGRVNALRSRLAGRWESGGVENASEKWGGHPHYRGLVHHLGADEHGDWLWGPAGRTIYRGDAGLFTAAQDALTAIIPGAWWAPVWFVDHPEIDLYVNINTPAVRDADRFVSTDLDLDVIRFTDGRVEVVDRDEFELHQVQYGYPDHIVVRTEAATAEALDLVLRRVAPFDGSAARAWVDRARASTFS